MSARFDVLLYNFEPALFSLNTIGEDVRLVYIYINVVFIFLQSQIRHVSQIHGFGRFVK